VVFTQCGHSLHEAAPTSEAPEPARAPHQGQTAGCVLSREHGDIYTDAMIMVAITVLLMGQADPAPDERIYEIQLGRDVIYGTWTKRPGGWEIYEDAPWKENRRRYVADPDHRMVTPPVEVPSKRPARLAEEARKAGFVEIAGKYVTLDEAGWAEKAADMIAEVRARDTAAPDADSSQAGADAAGDETGALAGPGFVAQWWLHALILAFSVILISLVARFAILA
jgi:hypothetical protein